MLFDQLEFHPHNIDPTGTAAKIMFPNGYGASVITDALFYTDSERPYELAVLDKGGLTYKTPITDDVIGHLTREEVEGYLVQIHDLQPAESAG